MAARKRSTGKPPPRPELLGLLAKVKEDPDDPAPRLVLADWLEEHGDEADRARAEHTRLGVAHAAAARAGDRREMGRLEGRLAELQSKHMAAWCGPLAAQAEKCTLLRGMVHAEFALRSFLSKKLQALAGTETWAWVEQAEVKTQTFPPEKVREFAACPLLATLAGLELYRADLRGSLRELLASPYLPRLRSLRLSSNELGDEGAKAIAAAPSLADLTSLGLVWNNVGSVGVKALAGSQHLTKLRDLNLRLGRIGPGAVQGLAASAGFANLGALNLSACRLRADGLDALTTSPHLRKLEHLNLGDNKFGSAGLIALTQSPDPPLLTDLDVSSNHIDDEGVRALAGSALLGSVRMLSLQSNRTGPEGAEALASSPHAANLRTLWLGSNTFRDRGAVAFARSPHLKNLQVLDLSHSGIRPEGVRAIVESDLPERLVHLGLGGTDVPADLAAELNRRCGHVYISTPLTGFFED